MTPNAPNGYDVIVVGAGPAGLCAAMYAGRGMLNALTIERGAPGGELLNTDLIEDYIGFESIKGWELAQKMTAHAKQFGAELVTDTVERIRKADEGWFEVATARGRLYRAPAVILTAGGTPVKLGVPGEKEHAGKGVSYCAVCDGAFFKGEVLAVVGGGDAAVEEADYLTRYASKVYIVHRRDQLRASKILQQRAFANPKIEVIWNKRVVEIKGPRPAHESRSDSQRRVRREHLSRHRRGGGRMRRHRSGRGGGPHSPRDRRRGRAPHRDLDHARPSRSRDGGRPRATGNGSARLPASRGPRAVRSGGPTRARVRGPGRPAARARRRAGGGGHGCGRAAPVHRPACAGALPRERVSRGRGRGLHR